MRGGGRAGQGVAKNAGMGHAQWEWCTQRSLKVRHPPNRILPGSCGLLQSMSMGIARTEVGAHPYRYRRSFLVIAVCGLRLFPLKPLHSANSILEGAVVYFDAHRIL